MEGVKVIDKKREEFIKIPQFTQVQIKEPNVLKPIHLEPLRPLKIEASFLLPKEILDSIGVRAEQSSFLDNILGCNSCSACKAVSR
jgi:hypothetical protein